MISGFENNHLRDAGGEGGIRTPDRAVKPYNGLANRRLQPLGHLSVDCGFPSIVSARIVFGEAGAGLQASCAGAGNDAQETVAFGRSVCAFAGGGAICSMARVFPAATSAAGQPSRAEHSRTE
jgi:hypothetical protein